MPQEIIIFLPASLQLNVTGTPPPSRRSRITCLDVYLKYYQCFRRTKKDMEDNNEKPFECSESFIFGKFETFKKRCEQIVYVLETTVKYSILQSSTIEGIDVFAEKFKQFFKTISSQKYDALNHRLPYFENDFNTFKQNVVDTEWELEEFVGASLDKMSDVDNILRLLKRCLKAHVTCHCTITEFAF
ncbi:dynein axonemal heavy chain 8-like [Rhynchophorus ferrugineus]|uniref:dynein axonemal heavy chain 8-like n=1 Tax=Rhynchophorus ferrugineus TaxID=354439 RepID=UPI003FCD2B14